MDGGADRSSQVAVDRQGIGMLDIDHPGRRWRDRGPAGIATKSSRASPAAPRAAGGEMDLTDHVM